MERQLNYEKQSIYFLIKNQQINKMDNKLALQLNEELQIGAELMKIKEKVNELQQKIVKDKEDIFSILKDLEFNLPQGNNNKRLSQVFFNSKLFLSIVECLNFSQSKYLLKLLNFIEKMLKGNKNISNYLSNNKEFVKRIFNLMKISNLYDICIKICEEIFMNANKLVPIFPFYKEIEENYNLISGTNLNSFCRILAIMIFDHKKMEFKQIFKYKENLKIRPAPKVTTENQSICYHLPKFMLNIVNTLKEKFNYTITTSNQIPMIYNLLNNTIESEDENMNLNNTNLLLDSYADHNIEMNPVKREIKIKFDFSSFNKKFKSLKNDEINTIIYANIFSNFTPDWSYLLNNLVPRENIFNTYTKISKMYKKIKNFGKIKENTKSKLLLNLDYINVLKYTTCQIEMLFVLSTLVGCKRKKEIQNQLSNYSIIGVLNDYIEYLEWGNIFNENNRPYFDMNEVNFSDDSAYHGRGCKCDSDTALKIQFLRFIYTYCCRDSSNVENKLNLISTDDLDRIFSQSYLSLFYFYLFSNYNKYKDNSHIKFNKIFNQFFVNVENNFYSSFVLNPYDESMKYEYNLQIQKIILNQASTENLKYFIEYYNNNYEKIGLLTKLIVKYIQECHHSSSKFWLASCIEVMIRGNNTFFQFFITANTGLMSYLIYDILYTKNEQAQIFQLSFDILGELIKFNKCNFLLLNYYFVDNNEFGLFTKKVIDPKSLIDSNVFLRSIIISINYFDFLEENQYKTFTKNCKFCSFVNKNLLLIFYSLIKVVKPDDINQTNISCINTALLILILKYKNRELATFLQQARTNFEDSKENIENFKNLISIWKEFYYYRPKDSSSLQHSTGIDFNTWQIVTWTLIDTDETNVESLFYKF